jgi:hypothetical protein
MKKYIAGLLTGVILSLSLTTFAAIKLEAVPSPFPILVDGIKSTIEAYNIKGSTYIKLADLKAAGVDANFNSEKKQIEIKTIEGSTTIAEPAIPESEKTNSGLPDFSVPEINQNQDPNIDYNDIEAVKNSNPINLTDNDNIETTTYNNKYKAIKYKDNIYVSEQDLHKFNNISVEREKLGIRKLYQNKILILETQNANPKYYVNYNGYTYFNINFLDKYLEN